MKVTRMRGRDKENGGDDSILLSSSSFGEDNTIEKHKFYRTQLKKKSKESCTIFLDPSIKAIHLRGGGPNGRETKRSRRMFKIPYSVFRYHLLDLAVEAGRQAEITWSSIYTWYCCHSFCCQ